MPHGRLLVGHGGDSSTSDEEGPLLTGAPAGSSTGLRSASALDLVAERDPSSSELWDDSAAVSPVALTTGMALSGPEQMGLPVAGGFGARPRVLASHSEDHLAVRWTAGPGSPAALPPAMALGAVPQPGPWSPDLRLDPMGSASPVSFASRHSELAPFGGGPRGSFSSGVSHRHSADFRRAVVVAREEAASRASLGDMASPLTTLTLLNRGCAECGAAQPFSSGVLGPVGAAGPGGDAPPPGPGGSIEPRILPVEALQLGEAGTPGPVDDGPCCPECGSRLDPATMRPWGSATPGLGRASAGFPRRASSATVRQRSRLAPVPESGDPGTTLSGSPPPAITPLPWRSLSIVLLVQFSEGMQLNMILPFVPFMVASFPEVDPSQVGFYSGILLSSFALGQLCSAYAWGRLADRLGPKKVITFSLSVTFVASFFFGLTKAYWQALALRFLAGLCNGNIGTIKSYLGRITDNTNQRLAFSYLSAVWSIGSVLAPFLGGLLYDPGRQYPGLFPAPFWLASPFFLPLLLASCFCLLSLVLTILLLDSGLSSGSARSTPDDPLEHQIGLEASMTIKPPAPPPGGLLPEALAALYADATRGIGRLYAGLAGCVRRARTSSPSRRYAPVQEDALGLGEAIPLRDLGPGEAGAQSAEAPALPPAGRNLLIATLVYGLFSMSNSSWDGMMPLFARLPVEEGGLGRTSSQSGLIFAAIGIATAPYSMFLYGHVSRRFHLVTLMRFGALMVIPITLALGLTQRVFVWTGSEALLWVMLVSVCISRGVNNVTGLTTVMVYINNSVPQSSLGEANGVGQTLAAMGRTIGPFLIGLIWGAAERAGMPGLALLAVCLLFLVVWLSSFLYHPTIFRSYEANLLDIQAEMDRAAAAAAAVTSAAAVGDSCPASPFVDRGGVSFSRSASSFAEGPALAAGGGMSAGRDHALGQHPHSPLMAGAR
ncbi:hypothetical protein H696_01933 [Fonticula alba]|uniref:Major facilitator superfamily (MFS) profile domain-containing protein n=1 Tax=Fonticula alba TaxID=691883 RepID=A0A058ZAM3_FONAL|nr:hypothetical protein H696_01933 [Fonticula alba]KCV70986.1 hypothetical protein H696_01933 [Fonticula alba]|eukprot:XP_009494109.1 hypothetical protein H696_01933 [Fonticula alba]